MTTNEIQRVARCTVADLTARHVQRRVRVFPIDYYDEGMLLDGPGIPHREGTLHAINALETDDDTAIVVTLIFQDVRTLWDLPLDTPCEVLDSENLDADDTSSDQVPGQLCLLELLEHAGV